MIFYTTVFIITIILFSLVPRCKSEASRRIMMCVAVLFPAAIGGMRDLSVGTDTEFYAEPIFIDALHTKSLPEFIEITTRGEPGYAIINWVVAQFTDNIHWALFAIQLVMWYFLVKALNERKCWNYVVPVIFMFMCYFYNNSLNLIRQMMASTCILYAYVLYQKQEYKKAALIMFIDFFFHKTSLFAIPFFIISVIVSKNNLRFKWLYVLVGFAGLFSVMYMMNDLLQAIATIDAFSNYQFYTSDHFGEGSNLTEMMGRGLILSFIFIMLKKRVISKEELDLYTMFLLFELFLFSLSSISRYLYRMAFYFSIFEILYIPEIIRRVKNSETRLIWSLIIYGSIYVQFVWLHVHHGIGATVPYTSLILGISK